MRHSHTRPTPHGAAASAPLNPPVTSTLPARVSAYHDEVGVLVTTPSGIVRHYAKTWLALDLVASFPFDWFIGDGGRTGTLPLLLRLAKVGKLLRVWRLKRVSFFRKSVDFYTSDTSVRARTASSSAQLRLKPMLKPLAYRPHTTKGCPS